MKIFLLFFFVAFNVCAQDIEDVFPSSHPSRKNFISVVFSPMQQSSWQWRRDGFYETRSNCQHWYHHGELTTVCLDREESLYRLSFSSDHNKEVMRFGFDDEKSWTLSELLEFDTDSFEKLNHFSSMRTGIQMDYKAGTLRFRGKIFGGFEFFSHTSPWGEAGVRQEVYGRCSFCSAKRFRAYLDQNGQVDYRSSSASGRLNPREWNDFLGRAYYGVLSEYSERLNFLSSEPIHD